MSDSQIERVNQTSRTNGGFVKPIIYNQVVGDLLKEQKIPKTGSFLDFGSGNPPSGTESLRKKHNLSITAYDIGDNVGEGVDENALSKRYDVVLVSNVLNVQPNWAEVTNVLKQVKRVVKKTGVVIANFPSSPRLINNDNDDQDKRVTTEAMEKEIENFFEIESLSGYNGKIWLLRK